MGGDLPSDKDMEMLALQLQAQERLKKELEEQASETTIDLGNDDLVEGDITESMLPDRRFTEMGKKMEEEEKNDESTEVSQTMISIEQYQEKTDEIERLQDLLEKEKENLIKEQKKVSDLHEAVKIAEQRMENAIAEREKFGDKNREMIHKISTMKDDLKDKEL